MAEDIAKDMGITVHTHLPENERWEPDGYKARNDKIAKECDKLVRIRATTSTTYGSGWTRDRAEDYGKPTEEFVVHTEDNNG